MNNSDEGKSPAFSHHSPLPTPPSPCYNHPVELRIEKIVYPGRSLGRAAGKVIFTDEGLPGELVEASLFREKPNYAEARTVKVIEAVPGRADPRCPHYRVCSPYQYIDYSVQLEIKQSQAREMFSHHLKMPCEELAIVPSPRVWGYRNKARLNLIRDQGDVSWAYHEPNSADEFVPLRECFLFSEMMNALFGAWLDVIRRHQLDWIEAATVRESLSQGKLLLLISGFHPRELAPLREAVQPLLSAFPLAGIGLSRPAGKGGEETLLLGDGVLEEEVDGVVYSYGPSSFFQVNLEMLPRLIGDIKGALALAGEETVADLYCGVGTIGLSLAPSAGEVIGVESSRDSVPYLRRNIVRNRAEKFTAVEGKSEQWARQLSARKIDVLIADPPRRGLASPLLERILSHPPARMVYLSCDLATLIRDLKKLLTAYRLTRIFLYDFFPHTPHLEICAVLER